MGIDTAAPGNSTRCKTLRSQYARSWVGQRAHVFKTDRCQAAYPEDQLGLSATLTQSPLEQDTYAPSVSFQLKNATSDGDDAPVPGEDVTLKIWLYAHGLSFFF